MDAIRRPLCVAVLVVITVGVAKATFEDLSDVGIDFSQAVLMKDIEFAQGIAFNDAQEIELEEVQNAPSVSLPVTSGPPGDDALCTFMMVDPDAPSKADPKFRFWLHWLRVNVACKSGPLTKGDEVVPFNPSAPPAGSGFHRYIFLLFQQEGKISPVPEEKYAGKFDVKAFAAKHNLKPEPIGAADYKTRKEEQLNLSGLGL